MPSIRKENYHEKLINERSKVLVKEIELESEIIDHEFYVYKIKRTGSKNQGELFVISKKKILKKTILVNVNPMQLGYRIIYFFNRES